MINKNSYDDIEYFEDQSKQAPDEIDISDMYSINEKIAEEYFNFYEKEVYGKINTKISFGSELTRKWLKVFSTGSIENNEYAHLALHLILGQIFCNPNLVVFKSPGKVGRDLRVHSFIVQSSGCLDENTEILLPENKKAKLKDLPDKFKVISHSFSSFTGNRNEVDDAIKIDSGEKEVFEIELEDGRKVIASKDHIFFKKENDKVIETKVDDLKINDMLAVRNYNKKLSEKNKGRNITWGHKFRTSAIKRWKNVSWVKKEMARRKILVLNGNYRERGKKTAIKLKGKTYEDIVGKEKAQIRKDKISNYMKNNNPMNNSIIRKKHLISMRKAHSEGKCPGFKKGEENISFGIPRYPKLRYVKELNHIVRSTYEEKVCKRLVREDINYQYEPKYFVLNNNGTKQTYTPDIKLYENTFIEIKCFIFDWQVDKLKLFIQQYPKINFYILTDNLKLKERLPFINNFIIVDEGFKNLDPLINKINRGELK